MVDGFVRSGLGAGRFNSALLRLARASRLDLPGWQLARLASSSAVTAAAYGAASNPVLGGAILKLRSTVKACVLKGSRYAAPEALFYGLRYSWRLDPVAVLVVAP